MTGPGGAGSPEPPGGFFPAVYDELKRLAAARLAGERAGHSLDATALVARGVPPPGRSDVRRPQRLLPRRGRRHAADPGRPRPPPQGRPPRRRGADDRPRRRCPRPECRPRPDPRRRRGTGTAAREDPSSAEVARHRLFAGLSIDETAEALGLSRATAFREWAYARSWLATALGLADDRRLRDRQWNVRPATVTFVPCSD